MRGSTVYSLYTRERIMTAETASRELPAQLVTTARPPSDVLSITTDVAGKADTIVGMTSPGPENCTSVEKPSRATAS